MHSLPGWRANHTMKHPQGHPGAVRAAKNQMGESPHGGVFRGKGTEAPVLSVSNDPQGSFIYDVMLSDTDLDGCELCREAREVGIEITTFDELVSLIALVLEIL